MPKTFAQLRNDVEQELQDTGNALWSEAELADVMEDALREMSEYDPWEVQEEFEFETRSGRATSTSANNLVDATEAQFRSSDVDKVVFNKTDRTWAVITSFSSTSQVGLSKDIMAVDEDYQIFNRDCRNVYQIYIGDITDYVGDYHGVSRVEYLILQNPPDYRNFKVERDVLWVDLDINIPDSKDDNLEARRVEAYVWFNKVHQVSQLTDLLGAAKGAESEGATSMDVDAVADETIVEGQEFTIANTRGRYHVTADVTPSGNTTSGNGLAFWPPVESAIADDAVVTFLGSSLNNTQERILTELAAGRAVMSKGTRYLRETNAALGELTVASSSLIQAMVRLEAQLADIATGRTQAGNVATQISNANTEMVKIEKEVDQALRTVETAGALTERVNVAGNVPGNLTGQASAQLGAARGFAEAARNYLAQASSRESLATTYASLAAGELQNAQGSIGQAQGHIALVSGQLDVAAASGRWHRWGAEKAERALSQLKRKQKPKQIRRFPAA